MSSSAITRLPDVDLKSPRRVGRPSNKERSTPSAIDADLREMAAELTRSLRKSIKEMNAQEKTNLLGKLLPYICLDKDEDRTDTTIESLVKKYVEKVTAGGDRQRQEARSKGQEARNKKSEI